MLTIWSALIPADIYFRRHTTLSFCATGRLRPANRPEILDTRRRLRRCPAQSLIPSSGRARGHSNSLSSSPCSSCSVSSRNFSWHRAPLQSHHIRLLECIPLSLHRLAEPYWAYHRDGSWDLGRPPLATQLRVSYSHTRTSLSLDSASTPSPATSWSHRQSTSTGPPLIGQRVWRGNATSGRLHLHRRGIPGLRHERSRGKLACQERVCSRIPAVCRTDVRWVGIHLGDWFVGVLEPAHGTNILSFSFGGRRSGKGVGLPRPEGTPGSKGVRGGSCCGMSACTIQP